MTKKLENFFFIYIIWIPVVTLKKPLEIEIWMFALFINIYNLVLTEYMWKNSRLWQKGEKIVKLWLYFKI